MYVTCVKTMKVFTLVRLRTVVVLEQMGIWGRLNWGNFKKSALSHHMYRDHLEHINKKLSIYSLGIIKSSSPSDIDRLEDYYVEHLDAKLSLLYIWSSFLTFIVQSFLYAALLLLFTILFILLLTFVFRKVFSLVFSKVLVFILSEV